VLRYCVGIDSKAHFLAPTALYGRYDLVASASHRKGDKKGRPNPAQENCDGSDLEICPDLILGALGAALAAGFAALFTAITMAGRRKRRSLSNEVVQYDTLLEDLAWHLGV